MKIKILKIVNLLPCGMLLLLLLVLRSVSLVAGERKQALLHGGKDGTLLVESAVDRNITFRLMGEAATLLVNDIDIVAVVQRRQRAIAAQSSAERREPVSLQTLKDQFRSVQRELSRLARRITNMQHGNTHSIPSQRTFRRQQERSQIVENTISTLEQLLANDDCSSNPCKNGGTCIDGYKSFRCLCYSGWQGSTCQDDVNECFDLANTDLAVCSNDAQCINTPGSYRCVCRNGYSGAHCRLRQNSCLANQSTELCGSHGSCVPSTNSLGYVCICEQGWTWADVNVTTASPSPCTRDVDECAPQINPCHRECINLPGSFRCGACPPGYTGDGKYCRDLNECADGNNGGCSQSPRVACINTEGSYRCGRCPVGWTGDGRSCTEVKSNSCNGEQICHPRAECEYISGTVVCTCPAGSYGHGYGKDGCHEDASRQPCDDHHCQNNGTCVLNGRGTSCICQPGYTGALCGEADACHPNPCQNGGTCRLLPGNHQQCLCSTGYTGSTCSNVRSYCGIILRNATGSLQFPGSDQPEYQPSERCAFIIRAPRGMILNVTFGFFELQQSVECGSDFLQLHDGSSLTARLIGRFCGNDLPLGNGSILTTQEQLFLWFRSDDANQAKGFNLTWLSQPLVCGEDLSPKLGQMGVLRSPSYPSKARPGLDCRWHLRAPYGMRFLLRFYDILLGNALGLNCSTGDYLSVRDADRQLYMACQSAQPAPLYSSSNVLKLHFHTDLRRADSSFQLHYEVVAGHPGCGGTFTEPVGLISNQDSEVCLYLIQQPPGTQIELKFLRLNLINFFDCSIHQLVIYDGNSDEYPLLGRFCGQRDQSEFETIYSSGNEVLLRYVDALPGLKIEKNFELRYSRVCNASFSDFMDGIIRTPNYPNGYYEDLTCIYRINGRPFTVVHLNITDLSLSGAEETDNEDLSLQLSDQSSYLDVYLSRNESDKHHFVKNLTNLLLISENNQVRLVFHGGKNPQLGRGLRVKYSFYPVTCGTVFTSPHGEIMKTITDENFCQWIIEAPGTKHLTLRCLPFREGTGSISVYDNSTGGEAKLLKSREFNSEKDFSAIFNEDTDSNLLTIIVRDIQMSILRMKYSPAETDCGGVFNARYGIIKSPNWPRKYSSSQNCTWIIRAPLGQQIELKVHNFSLEATSETCHDDYLEIRNGDRIESPLIGRYCGYHIPSRLPSFGNALYVHFQSDEYLENPGFQLSWYMAATGCGGKLNAPTGVIHSPHRIEGNYGAVSCDWQITVAQGSTINLTLQGAADMCNKQLMVYDGPTTRSVLFRLPCNSTDQQISLNSTSNRVLVRYDIDKDSPDGLDFVLEYTTNCRVQLNQLQGSIETPNFPENYPPNMDCEWDIRASGGGNNNLQLAFSHLLLEQEESDVCRFDDMVLADYRDDQLITERHVCSGNGLVINSTGNRLVIRFRSDFSNQAQGFHADYKRLGCGEELTSMGGSFESPNAPYSVDMDCNWKITAPEGYQIRLSIQDLHLETTQGGCKEVRLTILVDGLIVYQCCSLETSTQTFTSPGNELQVVYHSNSERARKYFKATYVLIPAKCGGYVTTSNGIITPPRWFLPGQDVFDKDVECSWTIEPPETYGTLMIVSQLNLTDSVNCSSAVLEITGTELGNSDPFSVRACGVNRLNPTEFQNQLHLKFKAKAGSWGRFIFSYVQICGGKREDAEGYLRANMDERCQWTITAPEGSKISLNINQLECTRCTAPAGNCTKGLSVSNLEDNVVYYNLCEEHPNLLLLPANKVLIKTVGIVFEAQYTSLENSCGGKISSVKGTLSSPNYPNSYPANVECIWTLEPRTGNALEINYEVMDIIKSDHCNADFLELRAGEQGPLLGLHCDNQLPDEPLVVYSKLWIKFRSIPGSSGNGFKLRWSYVHNIEVINSTNGIIESPAPLSVRGDDQPYSWRIFTERKQVIVLDFKEYNTGLLLFDGFDETGLSIDIEHSPWQFTSSSNVLYLKSVNSNFDHFLVKWHNQSHDEVKGNVSMTTSECEKLHVLQQDARLWLASPNYPRGYKPNLNCEWTFQSADESRHVFVELYRVDLEISENCQLDYLSIESSENLMDWHEQMRYCNLVRNLDGTAVKRLDGTPNLRMKFVTDAGINGTGFNSVIRTECGSNFTDMVGSIINSHKQRKDQLSDSYCEWRIAVRSGRLIEINIEYNGAALNVSCQHYGLIYDGLDAGAPLLPQGKFCNQLGFATVNYRSSGPHLYIKYLMPARMSRVNSEQNHWNLTYHEYIDCGGEVRLTEMANSYNISTPGYPYYPHPHTDCEWLILAPPGESIAATFVDSFDLSRHYCDLEFVELFDGATKLSRSLLRTCRSVPTIRSSGNLLLVHYQTDLSEPHGGFRLNVSISRCGGIYNAYSGFIESENYPGLGAYPKPAVCEYIVKVPINYHIQLNFSDLHLPYSSLELAESLDRIEVLDLTDQQRVLQIFYGNISSFSSPITFDTQELALRFYTVNTTTNKFRGFKLQYQTIFASCIRDVNAASGELNTPRTLSLVHTFKVCEWRITVPKGQRVRLEFLNLADMRSEHVMPRMRDLRIISTWRKFRFFNDIKQTSGITEFVTDTYNGSGIIESTDNFMRALMVLGPSSTTLTVRARFSSNEPSPCPSNIGRKASGILSNDNLRLLHLPNYYCKVFFMAEPGETLSFMVQEHYGGVSITDAVNFMSSPLPHSNNSFLLSTTLGYVTLLGKGNVDQHFRANYTRYPCGGEVRLAERSVIELPSIALHFGVLDCVWNLKNNLGYELSGNISLSDSCDREYLILSIAATGQELSKVCRGQSQWNTTSMETAFINLHYHATQYSAGISQFQLEASRPFTRTGLNDIINVWDKPIPLIVVNTQSYKNDMELSWEFQSVREKSMRVEFQGRFFIELSPNCTKDQLQILSFKQGLWEPIASYCGRELPEPLYVDSTRMRIIFRTNSNITADGFSFRVEPFCEVKLQASNQIQIHSLFKPRGSTKNCDYVISTDTDQQILVTVKVEPRDIPCDFSYFEGYRMVDGQEQLFNSRLCPEFETTGHKQLRLRHSTVDINYRKFDLQYELLGCGGNYTAPFILRSPPWKSGFVNPMNCEWHILAPPQHAIFLRFKYFELAESIECERDNLNIYRGNEQSNEQLVDRLCGNLTYPSIMVDSNQALIMLNLFRDFNQLRGFIASVHFTPNCNERLSLSEGNPHMSLVRQYQLNNTQQVEDELNCNFRASVPPGYRLSIWIKRLQLNFDMHMCIQCNFLEVVDGFNSDSMSLGTYRGVTGNGTKIFSSNNDVLIRLSGTEEAPVTLSFEIILEMMTTICGQLEYKLKQDQEVNIFIHSSNISSDYEGSIHCVWHFIPYKEYELHFHSLQLAEPSQSTGKCIDYVNISGRHRPSKHFCGQSKNLLVYLHFHSPFEMVFKTKGETTEYGLNVTIRPSLKCNGTYDELDGTIQNDFAHVSECIIYVKVPEGYSVVFELMSVSFRKMFGSFYLNMTDLRTNRTIWNITTEISYGSGLSKFTNTNSLRLTGHFVDHLRIYYYSQSNALPPGCGGDLTSINGQFSNPPYDNHNYSDCTWTISLPAGSKMYFTFEEFNMGSDINCPLDNIKFYEILSDNSERLRKTFCGETIPTSFYLPISRLRITAKKSPNFNGIGFRLQYKNDIDVYNMV